MEVLIAGGFMAAPELLLIFSLAVGCLHTIEEFGVAGTEPIWRYLRLTERDWVGALLLIGFLWVQGWLAVQGYRYDHAAALAGLLAIRLLDFGVSHWGPWLAGKRPNPGILTSPLYLIDALFIGAVLARF